ncbi:hypothetical protein GIB67_030956 [Kingdonia uniflora]|uniref:Uncharacterized protein n=1 Tax=Kingdonia uniflora TaxID=39325 RepID=A0A7J7L3P5_9MAGN|nr:hypothetical protein GIB67_030956 [Kingdonia uniflora]
MYGWCRYDLKVARGQGRGPVDMVSKPGEPVVAAVGRVLEMILACLSRYRCEMSVFVDVNFYCKHQC